MRLSCVGDNVANLAIHFVGTTVVNARHQRLVRLHHEVATGFRHISNEVGLIQIAVEAIIVGSHVKIDYVSILEGPLIGNTMANDLIDGSTATAWEVVVIPGGGVSASVNDVVVDHFIDLFGCDTHSHGSMASIQSLSSNTTHLAQLNKVLFIVYGCCLVCQRLKVLIWCACRCVVRLGDVGWDVSETIETVGEGSHRARKVPLCLAARLYSGLLVGHLVELPEASETLLSTEKGRGKLQLDASRTLHSGCFSTIGCCACLLIWLLRRWSVSL